MNNPMILDEQSFDREVREGELPVVVDFWAPWCPPCRAIAPVIDELAGEFDGRAKVAKVNVDENPNLAQRFGIASIPTLLLFKDGQVVDRVQGVVPQKVLAEKLTVLLGVGAAVGS